jgi:hypothetical protein
MDDGKKSDEIEKPKAESKPSEGKESGREQKAMREMGYAGDSKRGKSRETRSHSRGR